MGKNSHDLSSKMTKNDHFQYLVLKNWSILAKIDIYQIFSPLF